MPKAGTGTGTHLDPNISPIVDVKKRVLTAFKDYVATVGERLWKIADEAAYLSYTLSWKKKDIDVLFMESYEKALGMNREKMDKRQHANFRSECQKIYQITYTINRLTQKQYDIERKSGRAFYRVWSDLTNNYSEERAKKRTAKARTKEDNDKELADEVADGVVNAEDYAKATVSTSPKKKVKKGEDDEPTSWNAKPYNEIREIKKGLAALLATDKGKTEFIGIIQYLVNKQLLPEDWANLAEGLTI